MRIIQRKTNIAQESSCVNFDIIFPLEHAPFAFLFENRDTMTTEF